MSRPNSMFAEPRALQPDPAPEIEASPSLLPSGADLLVDQLVATAHAAQSATEALQRARVGGSALAVREAIAGLADVYRFDPKALTRRLISMTGRA